jgi:hypothetical protein
LFCFVVVAAAAVVFVVIVVVVVVNVYHMETPTACCYINSPSIQKKSHVRKVKAHKD